MRRIAQLFIVTATLLAALHAGEAGYFTARLTASGIDTVKVVGGCRPAVARAQSAVPEGS